MEVLNMKWWLYITCVCLKLQLVTVECQLVFSIVIYLEESFQSEYCMALK